MVEICKQLKTFFMSQLLIGVFAKTYDRDRYV